MSRKKSLASKLNKNPSKKIPIVPKEYFLRPHVPPPFVWNGKMENQKHYAYKIYLGEYIRDNMPFLKIDYEWNGLPSFYNERHNKFVNYTPDIFLTWHDDKSKISFYSDIEINGLVHYKSKDQILKVKERINHIYPLISILKEKGKREDYKTIGSYIVLEKDDFEYNHISDIYADTRIEMLKGGLYPKDIYKILEGYLSVAK